MKKILLFLLTMLGTISVFAQDAIIKIPNLKAAIFDLVGGANGWDLLATLQYAIIFTLFFSLTMRFNVKKNVAHNSLLAVSEKIYKTCKTYLIRQGKFLLFLFLPIFLIIVFYLSQVKSEDFSFVQITLTVFAFSLLGVFGSYAVAWYGIRLNTWSNARSAFASLQKSSWGVSSIPLQSGMAIGLFLISLELIIMISLLLFIPREMVNYCFLGFAIGESLGASVLRLVGGIFTKIADIGADLMKIIFKVGEDDPRNPAVIADCTGDNAGDSVGPTADAFETYGVTGVALISFIVLAIPDFHLQSKLIVWIFSMRIVMDIFSGVSYFVNQAISKRKYRNKTDFDFEEPLMRLLWITAASCITISFIASYFLIGDLPGAIWWKLASIISLGVLTSVIVPEVTKIFTSSKSIHCQEIVYSGKEGGAPLVILSGISSGHFSAYWQGMIFVIVMLISYIISMLPGMEQLPSAPIFATGLVAFGMLCMGPVSIAVDSYGPVADNAQSVYELSQIEKIPGIKEEIERDFGFTPDFEKAKERLERNDSCGNTFKATIKPVLIGTAVTGAITMIFSTILLLKNNGMLNLSLTEIPVLLGFIAGGAFVEWFSGGSIKAVVTGAHRATEFVKKNFNLNLEKAKDEDSQIVTGICTKYAQKGGEIIIPTLILTTLSFALIDPNYFISYLIGLSVIGMFRAIYMANAGGAWDNAKKVVEVDLKQKGTELHDATIVGDTVGDPFKDTTSVSFNPIIKFSSLFGLIAIEIAVATSVVKDGIASYTIYHRIIGVILFLISLIFIYKSFYGMLIKDKKEYKKA